MVKISRSSTWVCLFAIIFAVSAKSSAAKVSQELFSSRIIQAAQAQIRFSQESGDAETACSIYVLKVLNRAGFPSSGFTANEFDQEVLRSLSFLNSSSFLISNNDRESLRAFLNSKPDNSAFLAQWVRIGRSGHVASVVKEGSNRFTIYQAQQGLSRPHSKVATVESLLYSPTATGDRSNLRLFYP